MQFLKSRFACTSVHTNKPMNKCLIFVADLEETFGIPETGRSKVFFKTNLLTLMLILESLKFSTHYLLSNNTSTYILTYFSTSMFEYSNHIVDGNSVYYPDR